LSWFSKRWGLNAEVEYAKEMVRNPLLQGWEEVGAFPAKASQKERRQ